MVLASEEDKKLSQSSSHVIKQGKFARISLPLLTEELYLPKLTGVSQIADAKMFQQVLL